MLQMTQNDIDMIKINIVILFGLEGGGGFDVIVLGDHSVPFAIAPHLNDQSDPLT